MNARLGGPIGLIVVGLILAFGINVAIQVANLYLIGVILAAAGAVWLVIELIANGRRSARASPGALSTSSVRFARTADSRAHSGGDRRPAHAPQGPGQLPRAL